MELHEKATAALGWFTEGERKSEDTGRQIRVVRDPHGEGEPGHWVRELVYDAHDDGDGGGAMMPDDWRYEFTEDALLYLAEEGNDPDEYEPEPSIYNAELMRWCASHGWRAGYCDEADEELGSHEGGVIGSMGRGQWLEMRRVFDRVRAFLDATDDDDVQAYAAPAEAAS